MAMRVALLEDDPIQRDTLVAWLSEAGHSVAVWPRVHDFQAGLRRDSFDLLFLDWMLPDGDGLQVLRWLRSERQDAVPVIFITQRDAEEDVATALDAGADDYMVKPPRRVELLSRLAAVARRSQAATLDTAAFEVPPYRFEPVRSRVLLHGKPVADLTEKELQLALFLFRNTGRLLSRGHLLEAVWGMRSEVSTRTLDTHVSRIRRKLALHPDNGFHLVPIYSYGYRLERVDSQNS